MWEDETGPPTYVVLTITDTERQAAEKKAAIDKFNRLVNKAAVWLRDMPPGPAT